MSTDLPSQINSEISKLPLESQQRVLEFVRSLQRYGPGMSPASLDKHRGCITPEEGRKMAEAIEAGCEQVNLDEW
jgi:hypothetical protein